MFDKMNYVPIGRVLEGYEILQKCFETGYEPPYGNGPDEKKILSEGSKYLDHNWPQLSYIVDARRVPPDSVIDEEIPDDPENWAHVHCMIHIGSPHWYRQNYDMESGHPLETLMEFEIRPDWAPNGADRFIEMVRSGYLDGASFFRAIPNFLVQFGIAANDTMRDAWRRKPPLEDDPPRPDLPIDVGTLAFAGNGKDSRTTQIWMSLTDGDPDLGTRPWETPFGKVVGQHSLHALRHLNTEYGDRVDQSKIWTEGYSYLRRNFERLDYIKRCWVDELGPQHPVMLEEQGKHAQETPVPEDDGTQLAELGGLATFLVIMSCCFAILRFAARNKTVAAIFNEPLKDV